jgi:hypothetical protein
MVQRHVLEGEGHVLRQQALVQHLEAIQSPLMEKALALLVSFESSQDDHRRHLAQIVEEMRLGRRDLGGNLLPLHPR